jgi:hypothetical protein
MTISSTWNIRTAPGELLYFNSSDLVAVGRRWPSIKSEGSVKGIVMLGGVLHLAGGPLLCVFCKGWAAVLLVG